MNSEEKILSSRIVPAVKSFELKSQDLFELKAGCRICLACSEAGADELLLKLAKEYWELVPEVSLCEGAGEIAPEGYEIAITQDVLSIKAATLSGVRYALASLRLLAENERGVLKSTGRFILPCVEITDEPEMAFRGVHICIFPSPETTYVEAEREIRLAALYKYNYVVMEMWGTLRYPSHPEYCFEDKAFSPEEIKRLVLLAKELGVTVIPQFNIFGHATAARSCTHKHVLLERHPEYASLFEPNGWCWCLSNPETRKYIADIVNDLCDIFDNPPYFHLGCDEADGANSCALCRCADYQMLLRDHLLYFGELVKSRGARPMVWHDMFVKRGDERWKTYVACGTDATVPVLDMLTKDFIICDWRYDSTEDERNNKVKPSFATMQHFIDRGFDTIGCPWYDAVNTMKYGEAIAEQGAKGMLMTTWHRKNGWYLLREFLVGAQASWRPSRMEGDWQYFAVAVRMVNNDMKLTAYDDLGSSQYQMTTPYYQG